MFEYLSNPIGFKRELGQYLSRKVVTYFDGSTRVLRTPLELNNLDRLKLSYSFYETIHSDYLIGGIDGADIKDDISRYIDYMIPKVYKKYVEDLDIAPSKIKVNAADYGLIYHYDEI